MALPFLILDLDKERKFRFTIGDMAELLAWQRARAEKDGKSAGELAIEELFAQAPRDMDILFKMLHLGLRHDDPELELDAIGDMIHIGNLPQVMTAVMSFMQAKDGKPAKNGPRRTTVGKNRKGGTGASPSQPPTKSD